MKYLSFLILLTIFSCHYKPPGPDIQSGLVVNIPFDGTSIESVSGVTGAVYRATYAPDHHGEAGKAMYFNPTDSATVDFGALPMASIDSSNNFTISCWVKVADTTRPIAVLSKRSDVGPWEYAITNQFNHGGFILDNWVADGSTSVYGTDPLNALATIQSGQWQHLAYVADGQVLKVYLNGALQTGSDLHNSNYTFSKTAAHLVIGNGGGYGRNYYFNGCIDDIRMYNRPLSATSVQYLSIQ